jgi:hypothetical protein
MAVVVNEFEVVPGEASAGAPAETPPAPAAKPAPPKPTELERALRQIRDRRLRLRAD